MGPLANQGICWIGLAREGDHPRTLWEGCWPKVAAKITRQAMHAVMLDPRIRPKSNATSNRFRNVMLLKLKTLGDALWVFLKIF